MMDAVVVEQEALKLDLKSRGRLAAKLIESLDSLTPEEHNELWAAEADRRCRELDSGEVEAIPFDEVLREARSLLR